MTLSGVWWEAPGAGFAAWLCLACYTTSVAAVGFRWSQAAFIGLAVALLACSPDPPGGRHGGRRR